jgi:hypothetical protein
MSYGIKVKNMKKIITYLTLICAMIIVFASPVEAAITEQSFDVEVVVVTGDSEQTNANLLAQAYGTSVNVNLGAFEEDFVYFIANGKIISDENHQFRVTSDLYIVAVLKDTSEIVSVFLDSNGQFISADYLTDGQTPVAPDVSSYSKPGYSVDVVNPWLPAISTLNDNEVYTLQYSLDAVETFNITTTNATASNQTPAFNEIVTLTADGGATSGYWMENEAVIAYGTTYTFSALNDRDITFVESSNSEEAVVSFTDASGIRSGYDSFLGQVYLPDGYEVVEYGFLFKSVSIGELITMDDADVIKASSAMADTNEFLRSVTAGTYDIVRAYMVVDNGTSLETIYSENQLGDYYDTVLRSYQGQVKDYQGNVENVTVQLGAYSTTTDVNGSFTFDDLPYADYTITLSKTGYDNIVEDVQKNDLISSEVNQFELLQTAGMSGVFSGKNIEFTQGEFTVQRGIEGIYFTFIGTTEWRTTETQNERIELYLDTKTSTATRNDTNYFIAVKANATIEFIDNYGGTNTDSSTLIVDKVDGFTIALFIPYEFLDITSDEVIGVSIGVWNEFASDWDGWGFNGSFVAPEVPTNYVRIGADNQLYIADNNE